jgi:hypothetical protein
VLLVGRCIHAVKKHGKDLMNFPIDVKVTDLSSSSETPSEEPKDYPESLKTQLRKTFGADVLAPKTLKVSYVSISKVLLFVFVLCYYVF